MDEIPFTFLRELGKGKFGAVYEGENKKTGERRALKVVQKGSRVGKAERAVMKVLPEHPNIIHMESCLDIDDESCIFVLELCHTDLRAHIQNRGGKLDQEEARLLLRGIIRGLEVLQDNNIFHRDLKPENILLSISEDGHITPKLADFGLARLLRRPEELFHTFTGSPLYFAPEIWAQKGYTTKADIYSCGILLFEMLTGNPPFAFARNKLQLRRLALFSGVPGEDFEGLPGGEEGRVLLRRMLERDAEVRIDWEELFVHPWLFK